MWLILRITLYIVICAMYGVQYLFYKENNAVLIEYAERFLLSSLPLFFIGLSADISSVKQILYKLSIVSVYAMIIYRFVYGGGMVLTDYWWREDMVSSYNLLQHLLFVMLMMFERPTILNVVTTIIGVVLMISFGSRGPIVAVVVFAFMYAMIIKKWKHPLRTKSLFTLVICMFTLFYEPILKLLMSITEKMGMSKRIYTRLLEGTMFSASGRDDIQKQVFNAIWKNPIFGYGFGADQTLTGSYSHNIAIELWISLGIFIGTAVLIWMVIKMIRGINTAHDNFCKGFLLLLICCSFLKLLMSSTFLNEGLLYLMLGICVSYIRNRNTKPVSEDVLSTENGL